MLRPIGAGAITALVALGVTGFFGAAHAETTVSSKARAKLFSSQTKLLDRRAAKQYEGSARLRPESTHSNASLSTAGMASYRGNYRGQYLGVAKTAARKHGVPEDLFLRLVQQESGWHPSARSHKGAIGLAQLMPGTAAKLGVNPNDPKQNLEGGARYLKMMHQRYGDWQLALAAYNAGPGAVDKYGGVPPYKETRNYVRAIWGN